MSADEPGPVAVFVAPFEVRGQMEDAEFAGGSFAGSIASSLGQTPGIEVIQDGAEADRATRRLTGRLYREGPAVRAEARLVDGTNGDLLWQDELRSESGDLGRLAFLLAKNAAGGLGKQFPRLYEYVGDLTGGPEMASSPLLASVQEAWRRSDMETLLRGSASLVERFRDDPAAHAFEAAALSMAWDMEPTRDTLDRLTECLTELERLDPASPYVEILRAYLYRSSGEPERAQILYSRVLSRDDLSVRVRSWALRQRSYAHLQVGNRGAGREDAESAVRLDPAEAAGLFALSRVLESSGMVEEAVHCSRQALALDPERWRYAQRLGVALTRAGDANAAVEALERACRLSDAQEACANLAVALQRAGRQPDAREAAAYADSLTPSAWGLYNVACYRALAGERDAALRTLRRSLDQGFADALITKDSDLDSLRSDPEFRAMLEDVESRYRARRQLMDAAFPWQS